MIKSNKYTNPRNEKPTDIGKRYNVQRYTETGNYRQYNTLEYDNFGNVIEVTHKYNYDGDRKLSYYNSTGEFTRYNYNPDGTCSMIVNGNSKSGIYTERIYDAGKEVKRVRYDSNTMEVKTTNMGTGAISKYYTLFSVIQRNPLCP